MKTTMTMTMKKLIRPVTLACAVLFTSSLADAQKVSWKVTISPSGGGTVDWQTSSPAASGTLSKSGTVSFNSGSYVDLTFKTNTNYLLTSVFKNTDSWISSLDSNKHYQFGPVTNPHVITVLYKVNTPSGDFNLEFPDGKAPMVADISGNYKGVTKDSRNYDADVAMDESGKLSVIAAVDGIVPKNGGPIQGSVGSVKTVNNTPTAQCKGSFTGTRDGETTTASGSGTGKPLEFQNDGADLTSITGTGSGSAKVGAQKFSAKPTTVSHTLTDAEKSNLAKEWDLNLTIREITNSKTGKKSLAASSILDLPNGEKTFFKEKTVTFSVKTGYTISFSRGVKLDPSGNPILNPKTQKPVTDTKSSVKITKMIMTGSQKNWTVTSGTITYSFLGQKGTGNLADFYGAEELPEEIIFRNGNIWGVDNNPYAATTFTISKAYTITYINTYHWNYGSGTATPGQISLRHEDGTVYGPWQATGSLGQGGVPNANWECSPGTLIKAGNYTVVDSAPATWSQNSGSSGQGFSEVRGRP